MWPWPDPEFPGREADPKELQGPGRSLETCCNSGSEGKAKGKLVSRPDFLAGRSLFSSTPSTSLFPRATYGTEIVNSQGVTAIID